MSAAALSTTAPIVLLIVGLTVGVALGYLLALVRAASSGTGGGAAPSDREEAAQWRARAEELAQRAQIAEERSERDGSVLRALAPVRAQLERVGSQVEQMEQQRAAQHAALAEQLRHGAQAERELRRTTSELAGALRSRSSRGMWGEVELARILEVSGMMPHVDFSEQRSVGAVVRARSHAAPRTTEETTSLRPDVVIHLPAEGYLALDAKAPMDSYLKAVGAARATEAGADGGPASDGTGSAAHHHEYSRLMSAHARALRAHVEDLASRRYDQALGSSPELVVLFIPAEPVLAAALEADPTLLDHALSRGVALVSPSSLLALLRTCATAWARTAVNEDAAELLELGRTLYERLGVVARHLDVLGTSLGRAVGAYNKAVASMDARLIVTARSFDTLASALDGPRLVGSDEAQIRRFTAPELASAPTEHPGRDA